MKNKYTAVLLVLFAANAWNALADTTAGAVQTIDPTLSFFTALATCAPGNYTERNDLDGEVGQAWLNQIILGQENEICNVVLHTPDSRSMQCAFPVSELRGLLDQNFLQGVLDNTTSDSTKEAVKADLTWSQLKTSYCNFAPSITE